MRLYLELPDGAAITSTPVALGLDEDRARKLVLEQGESGEAGEIMMMLMKAATEFYAKTPQGNC